MELCPDVMHHSIAILQRVLSASVTVDQQIISSIGRGILVFAAMAPGDTTKEADSLANKVLKMRLWDSIDGDHVHLPPSIFRSPGGCLTRVSK